MKQELIHLNLPGNTMLFNVSYPIETMFYTDCIAYKQLPDEKILTQLIQEDSYILYVIVDLETPKWILENKAIQLLNTQVVNDD